MIPEWDAASNTWTIKLEGTGFTGTTATSELNIIGKKQEPIAIGNTFASFRVTDVFFGKAQYVNMYFDSGTPGPASYRALSDTGVQLTPKFVGVRNSNVGSAGGSTIILNV